MVEDDDASGAFITLSIARLTPFRALRVANAIEALELVKTLRPDLIVLDYQLPGITGLELHEKFEANEHLTGIPTLLMSANLPARARSTLAMSFIEKPFRLDDFLEIITHLLAE